MDFSIKIHPSQYQVHRGGAEIAKGYFLLIQSGLRRAVAASSAQAGDGDWIKNLFPSGLRLKPFDGYGTYQEPCPERTQGFLLGGISPPNKKIYSQRPQRLCGDNFILDKHEVGFHFLNALADITFHLSQAYYITTINHCCPRTVKLIATSVDFIGFFD